MYVTIDLNIRKHRDRFYSEARKAFAFGSVALIMAGIVGHYATSRINTPQKMAASAMTTIRTQLAPRSLNRRRALRAHRPFPTLPSALVAEPDAELVCLCPQRRHRAFHLL